MTLKDNNTGFPFKHRCERNATCREEFEEKEIGCRKDAN